MTRARLTFGIAIAIVLAPMLVFGDGTDTANPNDPNAIPTDWMTPKEQEAFKLVDKDKPVSARRVAEELLKQDDESIVGHYVLGRVLHEAEGDLGRAIYHLGHARELYEDRFGTSNPQAAPWKFHRDLLLSIISLAGEMEEYDYQLEMLRYHDELYRPSRIGEQAWPLFKLGEIDEARQAAKQAIDMKDPGQKSLGLNVLCAIERSNNDRDAAMKACQAAFEHAVTVDASIPPDDPNYTSTLAIHAYNAALAARANFQPQEAERIALLGSRRLAFTPANPWRFLTELYIDEGRGGEAANALREMHRWRTRQPPSLRDQDRAENDAEVATVMLLAGRTESALALIDRAIDFPDRRGLTSTEAWQAKAADVLLRHAIRIADDQIRAEADAITGDSGRTLMQSAEEKLNRWTDSEMLAGLMNSDDRLVDTFRLFGERGITPVPVWLIGDLADMLGPGVISVVLKMVREREKVPALTPYWDAIEADVHLARGEDGEARTMAEKALATLPETEALMRARASAVAAQAAYNSGDRRAYLDYLVRAYQLDPSIVRRRGMALPARFAGSGGAAADQTISLLRASPRFSSASDGFQVDVVASPELIRVCLRSPAGDELRCVPEDNTPPPPKPPGPDGKVPPPDPVTPQRAAEEFHHFAFSLNLGLTGADMSSLDGSTTVAEQAVRDRIDQVLDEVTKPSTP